MGTISITKSVFCATLLNLIVFSWSCSRGDSIALPEALPGYQNVSVENGDSAPKADENRDEGEDSPTETKGGGGVETEDETGDKPAEVPDPNDSSPLKPASVVRDGRYMITNAESGKCMEIVGDVDAPSAIQQAECTLEDRQIFRLVSQNNGQYAITNINGTMTLGIDGSSKNAGAALAQSPPTDAANQRFEIIEVLNVIIGAYFIRSSHSGLYLQVDAGAEDEGIPVEQATRGGDSNQIWSLLSVD